MVVMMIWFFSAFHFFFNDTATTEIYTLSLHDALPICVMVAEVMDMMVVIMVVAVIVMEVIDRKSTRLLQSPKDLVCRLLLEKKNNNQQYKAPNLPYTPYPKPKPNPPHHP